MITDHIHLDAHPEPLIAGEVLEKDSKGKSKSSPDYDNMWNLWSTPKKLQNKL
jgi:hypothetical protein